MKISEQQNKEELKEEIVKHSHSRDENPKNEIEKNSEIKGKESKKNVGNKFNKFFPDVSMINQTADTKKSLDVSFIDNEIRELTNELKEITKNAIDENEKEKLKIQKKSEQNDDENISNLEKEKGKGSEKKVDQNIPQDFIPLKDCPKFKEEVQIVEIEKNLQKIKEYKVKDGISNKLKFIDIKHDDVINFNDESIQSFFKSLNFILSENSKKRLNLLYLCIKHGFHILIPGPTGTGKTYLSEVICNLLKKNMIKYNCSENTKFPNLKFTCQGDKNKFDGIKYIKAFITNINFEKYSLFIR